MRIPETVLGPWNNLIDDLILHYPWLVPQPYMQTQAQTRNQMVPIYCKDTSN